jgi:hypothetical protein
MKPTITIIMLTGLALWALLSFTGCAAKKYYFESCQKVENGGYVCE